MKHMEKMTLSLLLALALLLGVAPVALAELAEGERKYTYVETSPTIFVYRDGKSLSAYSIDEGAVIDPGFDDLNSFSTSNPLRAGDVIELKFLASWTEIVGDEEKEYENIYVSASDLGENVSEYGHKITDMAVNWYMSGTDDVFATGNPYTIPADAIDKSLSKIEYSFNHSYINSEGIPATEQCTNPGEDSGDSDPFDCTSNPIPIKKQLVPVIPVHKIELYIDEPLDAVPDTANKPYVTVTWNGYQMEVDTAHSFPEYVLRAYKSKPGTTLTLKFYDDSGNPISTPGLNESTQNSNYPDAMYWSAESYGSGYFEPGSDLSVSAMTDNALSYTVTEEDKDKFVAFSLDQTPEGSSTTQRKFCVYICNPIGEADSGVSEEEAVCSLTVGSGSPQHFASIDAAFRAAALAAPASSDNVKVIKLLKDHTESAVFYGDKVTIDLNGCTWRAGNTSALTVDSGAEVTLNDSTGSGRIVACNRAIEYGGALYIKSNGKLTMTGGTITMDSNQADFPTNGGGVAVVGSGAAFAMTGGTITGCKAGNGGGIFAKSGGTVTVSGGTVSGNTATANGGGIALVNATGTVGNATVDGNTARNGGGIYASQTGGLTLSGATVSHNTATGNGGGVYKKGFTVEGDTSITHNTATGSAPTDNNILENNTTGSGGGVYGYGTGENSSTLTLTGNTAVKGGGGYSGTDIGSTGYQGQATITGNTAVQGGGWYGVCHFTGSTVIKENSLDAAKATDDLSARGPNLVLDDELAIREAERLSDGAEIHFIKLINNKSVFGRVSDAENYINTNLETELPKVQARFIHENGSVTFAMEEQTPKENPAILYLTFLPNFPLPIVSTGWAEEATTFTDILPRLKDARSRNYLSYHCLKTQVWDYESETEKQYQDVMHLLTDIVGDKAQDLTVSSTNLPQDIKRVVFNPDKYTMAGNITVGSDATLLLQSYATGSNGNERDFSNLGQFTGTVKAESGGTLVIHRSILKGPVVNDGGTVEVYRSAFTYPLDLNKVSIRSGYEHGSSRTSKEYTLLHKNFLTDYHGKTAAGSLPKSDSLLFIPLSDPYDGAFDLTGDALASLNYVTYEKLEPIIRTAPTAAENLVGTGAAQALLVPGENFADLTITDSTDHTVTYGFGTLEYRLKGTDNTWSEWSTEVPTATDVGTYTVQYRIRGNAYVYDSDPQTITVPILGAPTLETVPTGNDLTYNGSSQGLVTAGAATNGTLEYSLDGENWSTDIPTAKDVISEADRQAGNTAPTEYKVYYRVVGNEGYGNLTYETPITVTIHSKEISLTWSDTPLTYNGQPQQPTATADGLFNGDTCDVTVSGAQTNANPSDTPTYTATATALSNPNYKLPDAVTKDFTIARKTVNVSGLKAAKVYDGTTAGAALDASGASFDGLVSGDGLTISGGTAEIKGDSANAGADKLAEFSGLVLGGASAANYTLGTIAGTGEITQRPITITASAQTVTVDGTDAESGLNLDGSEITVDIGLGAAANDSAAANEGLVQGHALHSIQLTLASGANSTVGTKQDSVSVTATIYDGNTDVTANYAITYVSGALTVKGITPTLEGTLTAGEITYGQTLESSVISGTMKHGEIGVPGTFAWKEKTTRPAVANSNSTEYALVFIPTDQTRYAPVELTAKLTVNPKEISVNWSDLEFTYDGLPHVPTATAAGLEDGDTCDITVSGEQTNAGESYTATADSLSNPNYKLPADPTAAFHIAKAVVDTGITAPTANTLTYNGGDQTLIAAGSHSSGRKMLYSLDGETYSENLPTGRNAGTYTVYYKVQGDDNHQESQPATLTVTIEPKEIGLDWGNTSFTYDGQPHKPTATATGLEGNDTCDITVSGEQTNAGENYTATASIAEGSGNYKLPADPTAAFHIAKAVVDTGITAPTANTLTYNGGNQTLIAAGSHSSGRKMLYSLDGETYSENLPTGRNAGTYTVYYKVQGDDNHQESQPATLTVTVSPKEVGLDWSNTSFTYDGKPHKPAVSVTGLVEGDALTVDVAGEQTNAGENYTATASIAEGSGNYKLPDNPTTLFTVNKAQLTVKADAKSRVYGAENPALTYTVEGLADGDTLTGDLECAANVETGADTETDITQGTLSLGDKSGNYTLHYTGAKLKVVKATQAAPAPGEGYAISADRQITVSDTASGTGYEVYEFSGNTPVRVASGATLDPSKTYCIRRGENNNYAASPYTPVVFDTVSVTAASEDAAKGTVIGGGTVLKGVSVTVTATPQSGFHFAGWADRSGRIVSTKATYTFPATGDTALTARFTEKTVATLPETTNSTYDGNEKNGFVVDENDLYTVVSGSASGTNAGTYVATLRLKDPSATVWPDGSTADKTVKWRIDKKEQEKPAVSCNDTSISVPTDSGRIVEYSTDGGRTWTAAEGGTINGTDNTTYYIRYKETDNCYASPNALVKRNVPPSVTTIQPSALTSNSVTLNGAVSTTEGVSAVRFQYRRAGDAEWTNSENKTATVGFSRELSGLTPDTDYEFRAVAQLTAGGTAEGAAMTFRTPKAAPVDNGQLGVTVSNTNNSEKTVFVTIEDGNSVIATRSIQSLAAGGIGQVSFDQLPAGTYNVVVRTADGDYTETRLVTVTGTPTSELFTVPVGKVATLVEVKPDTPETAATGLTEILTQDDLNDAAAGSRNVEVKLEVETAKEENIQTEKTNIEALIDPSTRQIDTYLDLGLFKTTTDLDAAGNTTGVDIRDIGKVNSTVLEIAIRYSAARTRSDLTMYRYHDSLSEALTRLTARPSGSFVDGTFYLDATGYIYLYASGFSIYAIGSPKTSGAPVVPVPLEPAPTADRARRESSDSSDNSDSSGGAANYRVTVNASANGTVRADRTFASSGSEVTLSVTPGGGYTVGTVTVTGNDGKSVVVTRNAAGTYSFTMPGCAVTVNVSYIKSPLSPWETGVADWLICDEHIIYLNGYTDGSIRPTGKITRAETAMIFYRLLKDRTAAASGAFSDIPPEAWYSEAVGTLSGIGMINGYEDGSFRPDNPITRAEFAAIATRFASVTGGGTVFTDVPSGYWAERNIAAASDCGWINGYGDGTYGPMDYITRALAATIVNHMLGRAADQAYVLSNREKLARFNDLRDTEKWYYFDMVEASTAHDYTRMDGAERWTGNG